MPRPSPFLLAIPALLVLGACARASGEPVGGDVIFDAAPPAVVEYCLRGDDPTAAPRPATWSAIYADYFGGSAYSACAGNGHCHGPGGSGDALAQHECRPDDKDACYASMTDAKDGGRKPIILKGNPEESLILEALRKEDGGGIMPQQPRCAFRARDIERIRSWIAAGASND